jgi:hypothetical protein
MASKKTKKPPVKKKTKKVTKNSADYSPEDLVEINNTINRLQQEINQILDLYKNETNKITNTLESLNVSNFLQDLMKKGD